MLDCWESLERLSILLLLVNEDALKLLDDNDDDEFEPAFLL